MAGNGTIGLEILEDLPDPNPDAVVIPHRGGGLTAGIASAIKALRPQTRIVTAEPRPRRAVRCAGRRASGHGGLPRLVHRWVCSTRAAARPRSRNGAREPAHVQARDGAADDLVARSLEQGGEALAKEDVVVCHQDAFAAHA